MTKRNETTPTPPVDPHAVTRALAEQLAQTTRALYPDSVPPKTLGGWMEAVGESPWERLVDVARAAYPAAPAHDPHAHDVAAAEDAGFALGLALGRAYYMNGGAR
jgi:hypothetical protein